MLTSWKESYDQPRQHIKKQRYYFANKGPSSQGYGFSSGHVWMGDLDYKESWVLKNWCFWTVVLEKTLESPLDCKEIQPVHPKGNQSWVFIGRTDVEAETPGLWQPDAKGWLIWKDPDAGKDWGQEEKGTTEDEMAGCHHRLKWTRVWVNSGSWWWIGQPAVLWFMGSQRVGHNWVTELNWSYLGSPTHLGKKFPAEGKDVAKLSWTKDGVVKDNIRELSEKVKTILYLQSEWSALSLRISYRRSSMTCFTLRPHLPGCPFKNRVRIQISSGL